MHDKPRFKRFFYFMDTTSCPFQKTRSVFFSIDIHKNDVFYQLKEG
jgi:hypothetical protein